MLGLIDIPSPFAPTKELQECLRELLKIPAQDDPSVRSAIAQVRRSLAHPPKVPPAAVQHPR
jgi:hypothetical protein